MDKKYKIDDLVLDGFEIVKYLGYEEDEDDYYHVLLSLIKGKYKTSAVCGPAVIKDSADYDRILRLWNLNEQNYLKKLDEEFDYINKFCSEIEVPIGYEIFNQPDGIIWILNKNISTEFYKQFIDKIRIDFYQLDNMLYKSMMKEIILSKCKN